MPTFPPTAEQTAIVEAALTGKNVVARAGAGTGKTSTTVLVAEALADKDIGYLAFNSGIAKEAASKMPHHVESDTIHGFAYRYVIRFPGSRFGKRLAERRPSAYDVAKALGIHSPMSFMVKTPEGEIERTLRTTTLGYIATRTVELFCQSAGTEIIERHVPKQDGLDEPAQAKLAAYILPLARRIWEDVTDEGASTFKFDHCHYQKMYQLAIRRGETVFQVMRGGQVKPSGKGRKGGKLVPAQVMIYDEAQDASPVTRDIVQHTKAQVIVVGDAAQAIYGFTGAINAMDQFDAAFDLKLTKSFRFGPAVAEVANKLLAQMDDTDMQISGHDPIPSVVTLDLESNGTEPNAILARTNAGCVGAAMEEQTKGRKVALLLSGGLENLRRFAEGADNLMAGERAEHPELAAFKSWEEVQVFSKTDEGSDIRPLVALIDNYGTAAIHDVIRNSLSERDAHRADVQVVTAHRSKGLEWDRVKIAPDFTPPKDGGSPSLPDLRLMYVAVTRARLYLNASSIEWGINPQTNTDETEEEGL